MAQAFIDNIVKLHGAPLVIISDMGIIVTIKMWNQILKSLNIQLRYNYSYTPPPSILWRNERVNQGFENIYDAWCSMNNLQAMYGFAPLLISFL